MHPNISITSIQKSIGRFLGNRQYSNIAVLVDENTRKHCLPKIESRVNANRIIEITSGEENKTLETCQKIWQALTNWAFDRNSLLINLGGGVIGDMGGFCAATYKRGIDFINIPTTLLSMVDASVGGKLGIDFGDFKNHIGLFHEPKSVLIDPIFLNTLPKRELKSGYAEVAKHALVQDKDQWNALMTQDFESLDWHKIIEHSVTIKSAVVKADPTEKGERKILNFGHTIGHAIESHYLKKEGRKLLHGEAIAIGMICEAYLSVDKLALPKETLDEIQRHLISVFGKVKLESDDFDGIAQMMVQDKKNDSGTVRAVLLTKIGTPQIDVPITEIETKRALKYYVSLDV